MTETGSPDGGAEQVRDDSDHPETNLAGDEANEDLRHDMEALPHREASLYRFVDRPLPLDSVLSLGSQFLAEDAESVASALDSLVSKGLLVFNAGMVERPGTSDVYHELLPERSSSSQQLDSEAAAPRDPMKAAYDEWNALASKHPEWTIVAAPGREDETMSVDLDDPAGSMGKLKGKIQYDRSSVRPGDEADFERFLELDARIEEFEAQGGYDKGASLRAVARYRMAGGRVRCFALFVAGVRRVAAGHELGRGDLVQALAEEIAEKDHACALADLPVDQQIQIMQKAEQQSFDRFPMVTKADFGSPSVGDDGSPPPAADPELAPQGFESITGPDGKKNWRSKSDPNVKLERPDPNAV